MTTTRLSRLSGLGLLVGAAAFIVHIVWRSVLTAGPEPAVFAQGALWVPVNALGAAGAALVLLGLPAFYVPTAGATGWPHLAGLVLLAGAWMFFGLSLSLYSMLVLPWLADTAPALIAASAALPTAFVVTFTASLVAWVAGALLFAMPFVRGRIRPRWVGVLVVTSALGLVIGNLVIAPAGPATNLVVNLLSNVGPVLLLSAAGYLGARTWRGESLTSRSERHIAA
ncbi:MAG: hypothetical protein HOP14_14835 [Acidobacteria bacterium]|nr:hypothetical protein [Acidobacteriota bacterium]